MHRVVSLVAAALVAMAVPAVAQEPAPVGPQAVLGVIDTGINPYHQVFRDDSARAFQHPSTYLEGYPADAEALNLTFGAEDFWEAVKADCETVWKQVVPGKTYWFPGTKIVAAISFENPATVNCNVDKPTGIKILDYNGHGTMTASRATSTEYGACNECLVAAIQYLGSVNLVSPGGSENPPMASIDYAAKNAGWIDAQSNSWGPIVPVWDPTRAGGLLGAHPGFVRKVEEVSQRHLAFWASGNGAAFRGGLLGHPTLLSPHLGPSAISVGGHDSGYVNVWPGFPPHLVSDSCSAWAAENESLDVSGEKIAGGTSGATPFVAGGAVRMLLEVRRIFGDNATGVDDGVVARGPAGLFASGPLADGVLTKAEWREVLLKTATERPVRQFEDGPPCDPGQFGPTPMKWNEVPAQYPEYLHIGYGSIDGPSHERAMAVLRGEAPMPNRGDTDQYFALDAQARAGLHQVFRGPNGAI